MHCIVFSKQSYRKNKILGHFLIYINSLCSQTTNYFLRKTTTPSCFFPSIMMQRGESNLT